MSFLRANNLGWALYEVFTSAQANQLDIDHSNALDGLHGGSYGPDATLEIEAQTGAADPAVVIRGVPTAIHAGGGSGVSGFATGAARSGVIGNGPAVGAGYGVTGWGYTANSVAVQGWGDIIGDSNVTGVSGYGTGANPGVNGIATGGPGVLGTGVGAFAGVRGDAGATGPGVYGVSGGSNDGVRGLCSDDGAGVTGLAHLGNGVHGESLHGYGVEAQGAADPSVAGNHAALRIVPQDHDPSTLDDGAVWLPTDVPSMRVRCDSKTERILFESSGQVLHTAGRINLGAAPGIEKALNIGAVAYQDSDMQLKATFSSAMNDGSYIVTTGANLSSGNTVHVETTNAGYIVLEVHDTGGLRIALTTLSDSVHLHFALHYGVLA